MQIDEYSKNALTTLTDSDKFGDIDAKLMDQVLGLVGEGGEVADKFKKLMRDKDGALTDDDKKEIIKELGDVLWYVNSIAHLLGSDLTEVARLNNEKLASRQKRGMINGSGDNR